MKPLLLILVTLIAFLFTPRSFPQTNVDLESTLIHLENMLYQYQKKADSIKRELLKINIVRYEAISQDFNSLQKKSSPTTNTNPEISF